MTTDGRHVNGTLLPPSPPAAAAGRGPGRQQQRQWPVASSWRRPLLAESWGLPKSLAAFLLLACSFALMILIAQQQQTPTDLQRSPVVASSNDVEPSQTLQPPPPPVTILPPPQLRPSVRVNIREWTRRISEDIRVVGNKTNCLTNIERFFEQRAETRTLDLAKARDNILSQIHTLLAQHRAAVNDIAAEAEKLAVAHRYDKNLRFNYTDVHRLRNELDPLPPPLPATANGSQLDPSAQSAGGDQASGAGGGGGAGGQAGLQVPQFTSIAGGTPVPGPAEWQTPIRSIVMQVNKNFGDIPVNTSMSAVHLPLPIYAGLPDIMNGIAWTERLDGVFKRNLANFMHVHHQYYGDHLGFLRTFPAHRWRIPRTDPDLFDARTRPWYVTGAASPKDIVILVDTSGSMTGLRREIAKGVVFELLDTLTNNDYFAVMRFSETVTPIGLPRCNLRTPKLGPAIEAQCQATAGGMEGGPRERFECAAYRRQWEARNQYLRDHPNIVPGKNGSYLTDNIYQQSIANVTEEIRDAYLLPATSRNIRYLKSNFSMPTAGIANFTHALMAAFELLQAYNRTGDQGAQCNQAIMLITDGAIRPHDDIFNRYNYPNAPVRVFTYMIGREVGDITHTKSMACRNRGYYTHVINLSEVREQVQKYLPVMARPLVLAHQRPTSWTYAYGDETHQVLTDWVLETKRRERARIMLNEERERLNEANSTDVINVELTNIPEYDELPLVDEQLRNRIICEDSNEDPVAMEQSLEEELDPLGYNELGCHWSSRRADLLTSVVKPVFDTRNTSLIFERVLQKNVWTEKAMHVRNAQLLGVAAVDLRIADIMRTAPTHLLGPNAYAILMGPHGFVMHHPDLRALLEDPFDKQSKILKPYFSSVDFTHIEQFHARNAANQDPASAGDSQPPAARRRGGSGGAGAGGANDDQRLFKLREAAVKRQTSQETVYVKRAVDCRRRLHIRQQTFAFGPIKDTPFSLMLALPSNYGLNRLAARMELSQQHLQAYLKPSDYDLWTVHPEWKYCEGGRLKQSNSVQGIVEVLQLAGGSSAESIDYDDLTTVDGGSKATAASSAGGRHSSASASGGRIVCDKELLPALLFDAAATHVQPDTFCGGPTAAAAFDPNCDRPPRSMAFSSFYSSFGSGESCARTPNEMRSVMANIYGLEMSFLATRSGLTRVRVFDLSARIKKLADLFIQRHNKAVDEPWYSRTVDWNMRFSEEATIISVPFNAYVRLVAKLRQRITQRHPVNDSRSNCDFVDETEEPGATSTDEGNNTSSGSGAQTTGTSSSDEPIVGGSMTAASTPQVTSDSNSAAQGDDPAGGGALLLADEPLAPAVGDPSTTTSGGQQQQQAATSAQQQQQQQATASTADSVQRINYNNYSSFDFLDLIANSSVHVAATQSVIINKGTKQRSPVAVSGLLYDYATFARRFLNATSLRIEQLTPPSVDETIDESGQSAPPGSTAQQVKVDICPGGECPTKCGFRNDTIDCLLVDNNGFIVVGEELAHIGRSLNDYDEGLMQSLISKRVFHAIQLTDYQAICTRNEQSDPRAAAISLASAQTASSSWSTTLAGGLTTNPLRWELVGALASNLATMAAWLWTALGSTLLYQSTGSESWRPELAALLGLGEQMQLQRSVGGLVDAQSAVANQSLLALLPNKTYLRPCEKTITLYETRPVEANRQPDSDLPEYYVSKCGCSSWYVYDFVPKTNLIMLIVNTSSACRRCEPVATATVLTPLAGSPNFVPVVTALELQQQTLLNATLASAAANKSAEEQVCAMLERDSQLYVRRQPQQQQETCYAYHPDEAQIHLCGAASPSAPVSHPLLIGASLLAAATLLTLIMRDGQWEQQQQQRR